MHKCDGYAYQFGETVKQKVVNFVHKPTQLLDNPTQLNLFDVSEIKTDTKPQTKRKSKSKSSGFEGEQLSLF